MPLITCSTRDSVQADHKFQITRGGKTVGGWERLTALSPSEELFHDYLRWKSWGVWPRMWPEYEHRFLEEMKRPAAQVYLRMIAKYLRTGETVALSCFCADEEYCHRSLVRRLLMELFGEG